jgi:glycosyltransferase involved in cell wall biosynthesis
VFFGFALEIKKMNPKVSVCIVTYNHEKYIRQCLQSVVDQKINFEIEIIVSDDCSTDKTREIISEFANLYPSTIKPIFLEKNVGAYDNFILTHQLAMGEYVCHCDGDDYFLDGKLQAQVDVLGADKNCTAVWHRVDFFDDAGNFCSGNTADLTPFKNGIVTFEKAICLGFVGMHSSFMYRRSAQKYPPTIGTTVLDLFRTWDVLSSGNGKILDAVLGRYRVGATGSLTVSSQVKIRRLSIAHARFFYKKFPAMRKSFYIFAISNFIVDAKNGRIAALDFLAFSMECFSLVSIFKLIENCRDMRRIQVDWKRRRENKG